jgi:hypothetical protein
MQPQRRVDLAPDRRARRTFRNGGDATVHCVYQGVPLHAFSRAVGKARVWDGDGVPSPWSEAARFEPSPLTAGDWNLGSGE